MSHLCPGAIYEHGITTMFLMSKWLEPDVFTTSQAYPDYEFPENTPYIAYYPQTNRAILTESGEDVHEVFVVQKWSEVMQ